MPDDGSLPDDYIDRLASLVEEHMDLDGILEVAAQANVPACKASTLAVARASSLPSARVRIGVARDAAFCFYYHEYASHSLAVPTLHGLAASHAIS